jgi:hypothetical protein
MAKTIELPTDLILRIWDTYQGIWHKHKGYGLQFTNAQLHSLIGTVYQASLRSDE